MAFIHESLYQNKNFSGLDLSEYIDGPGPQPADEPACMDGSPWKWT